MKFFAKASQKKAELYIYDSIGGGWFDDGITAKSVKDALAEFTPGSELDVFINSPGGSVFEGLAIYNQLLRWSGKKRVQVDGIAASIASVVMMAGDEILMADASTTMIHRPWGMSAGTAEDMRKYADSLDKIDETLLNVYADRTGASKADIRQWMDAETWMNADEAVERGFATGKVQQKAIKAEFPLLAKYMNTPQTLRKQASSSNTLLARMEMRAAKISRGASPAKA